MSVPVDCCDGHPVLPKTVCNLYSVGNARRRELQMIVSSTNCPTRHRHHMPIPPRSTKPRSDWFANELAAHNSWHKNTRSPELRVLPGRYTGRLKADDTEGQSQ